MSAIWQLCGRFGYDRSCRGFSYIAFACRPVCFVAYTFVSADVVPALQGEALVACFVEVRIVQVVVAKERCS